MPVGHRVPECPAIAGIGRFISESVRFLIVLQGPMFACKTRPPRGGSRGGSGTLYSPTLGWTLEQVGGGGGFRTPEGAVTPYRIRNPALSTAQSRLQSLTRPGIQPGRNYYAANHFLCRFTISFLCPKRDKAVRIPGSSTWCPSAWTANITSEPVIPGRFRTA